MAFLDPSAFVGTYPAVNLRFARHPTTIADLTRLPAVTRHTRLCHARDFALRPTL